MPTVTKSSLTSLMKYFKQEGSWENIEGEMLPKTLLQISLNAFSIKKFFSEVLYIQDCNIIPGNTKRMEMHTLVEGTCVLRLLLQACLPCKLVDTPAGRERPRLRIQSRYKPQNASTPNSFRMTSHRSGRIHPEPINIIFYKIVDTNC